MPGSHKVFLRSKLPKRIVEQIFDVPLAAIYSSEANFEANYTSKPLMFR